MHSFRRPHRALRPTGGLLEQAVRGDADGGDRVPGADVEAAPGQPVLGPDAEDAARLVAEEADGPDPRRHRRTVGRSRARHVDGIEGVVLLGVAEAHCSDQRVRPQGGGGLQGGAAREMAGAGQMPAGPQVIQKQSGAHVRALPPSAREREEELDRPHEVRRQLRQQQAPFSQGLVHEPELEHLEVAQPAVDQLARPARRSGGDVDRLDQPGRQAARHRVERDADAGDPAADDEDVEPLPLEPGDGLRTGLGAEGSFRHDSTRT